MEAITFNTGEALAAPASPRRPGPCAVVIFGATGDLASRKLVPALYNLGVGGSLPEDFALVGFSRRVPEGPAWAAALEQSTARFSRTPLDASVWERFSHGVQTVSGDIDDPDAYARIKAALDDSAARTGGNTLFYLATPSSAFPVILPRLKAAGLIHPPSAEGPWTRVIVEKPFGHDLESAVRLNSLAASVLDESQVYRIDHYLGKETVQNLLVLRFGNSIFEPLWNHHYVDHVQITAAESIGIESRGSFYEETGVMRDIVQNHLLQVLALVAMEPPISFDANEIRDMKSQALRALRPFDHDALGRDVLFGQYEGYRDEKGVSPTSRVPTYVAQRMFIDNWRWQGVPFYLRAGKGLSRRMTEVRVTFKSIPHCLFGSADVCLRIDPNALVIRIQPDEGVALRFASKVPGEDLSVAPVTMDFRYAQGFRQAAPEAYERLLLDAMRGDPTLFARRDEVEHAWRYVDPVLREWETGSQAPLLRYARGSKGPVEADALPGADGNHWESLA